MKRSKFIKILGGLTALPFVAKAIPKEKGLGDPWNKLGFDPNEIDVITSDGTLSDGILPHEKAVVRGEDLVYALERQAKINKRS